jgi:hypothetical protein
MVKFNITPNYSVQYLPDGLGAVVLVNGGTYHVHLGHVYLGASLMEALCHETEIVGEEAEVVKGCL